MKRILSVGIAVMDVLVKPVSAETIKNDTTRADFVKLTGGGDAFNVASDLAQLGADATLLALIGDDELGKILSSQLISRGVRLALREIPTHTSTAAVLISPDSERSFVSYHGASHELTCADVPDSAIEASDIMTYNSLFGLPRMDSGDAARLLRRAKEMGKLTALDVTGRLDDTKFGVLRDALTYTDIFMPSRREVVCLTGERDMERAARMFCEMGPKITVIKLGSEGALACAGGAIYVSPAVPTEAVDTTGAGDAFFAGFMEAYSRELDISSCLARANLAGSICASHPGASGMFGG